MGKKRRKSDNPKGRVHACTIEIPYSVELVRKLRDEAIARGETDIVLDGDLINCRSLRLDTFFELGTTCKHCGLEGVHFIKEKSMKDERWHINLYGILDEEGKERLMTQDHVIPKSRYEEIFGHTMGRDCLTNSQTLCSRCNGKKGNDISEDEISRLLLRGAC